MNFDNAPQRGMIYALYKDRVEFRKYEKDQLFVEPEQEENLLELHLFDAISEYRYIKTRSGDIKAVISDSLVDYDDCYTERIYTLKDKKEKPEKDAICVEVVNYITYDENDLMRIENYRLKEVK